MAEMAVSFARDVLLPILKDEAKLLWNIPKEFKDIEKKLEDVQDLLKDADGRAAEEGDNRNEGIKRWVKQLREVSFRIEDVVDEYMILVEQQPNNDPGCAVLLCQIVHYIETLMRRRRIASEIQQIKLVVDGISQQSEGHGLRRQLFSQLGQSTYRVQWVDPRKRSRYLNKDEVVGFERPRKQLIDWLVGEPTERSVVSVIGMGGQGKTTLVSSIFNDQTVIAHFKSHAWITVSQSYKVESLMISLLNKLYKEEEKEPPQKISEMDQDSLIDEVRNYLQHKRYVVIFDDVWSVLLWSQIENAMVDNKNGSRILITTRKKEVVDSCKNSPFDQVYELQPLTFEQSMKLFCKMAFRFHNGHYPDNFMNISYDFVTKCNGLPLAIVVVGCLLSHKQKTLFEWEKAKQSLNSEMKKDSHLIGITKILGFSYDDLPYYLKSCLLYFGIYPKNNKIKSKRIIRQWIAEGFVKDEEGKTLEDTAHQYLTELIDRSLVQVSSYTIDGKAKSCRVHDLLRDMIFIKFKDLSFCHNIDIENESMSNEMTRRLSIATNSNDLMRSTESSHTRSLLVFAGKGSALTNNFVERIPTMYRLLKVLDFEDGQLNFVPKSWENLVHLKYLSLRQTWMIVHCLPIFIGKLQNLETLDIRKTFITEIPKEICELRKLRHLLGDNMMLFHLKKSLGGMTSLQTLQQVKLITDEDDYGEELINDEDVEDLIAELGKLEQLRNLALTGVKEEHGSTLCSSINKMQKLEKLHIESTSEDEVIDLHALSSLPMLQRLSLVGKLNSFPAWVPQLQNLIKLSLKHSKLSYDPLQSLQNMPYLLFLNIDVDAYKGERLHFQNGGFRQLKELHLKGLFHLKSIIIDEGTQESLENLQFWAIPQLQTIPRGIQHLKRLKVLDIACMSTEFNKSIVPDGGPENQVIQHVPLVRIITMIGGELETRIISH